MESDMMIDSGIEQNKDIAHYFTHFDTSSGKCVHLQRALSQGSRVKYAKILFSVKKPKYFH